MERLNCGRTSSCLVARAAGRGFASTGRRSRGGMPLGRQVNPPKDPGPAIALRFGAGIPLGFRPGAAGAGPPPPSIPGRSIPDLRPGWRAGTGEFETSALQACPTALPPRGGAVPCRCARHRRNAGIFPYGDAQGPSVGFKRPGRGSTPAHRWYLRMLRKKRQCFRGVSAPRGGGFDFY